MTPRSLLDRVGSRIRRGRFSATPVYAWRMRAVSALDRTDFGRRVIQLLMRAVVHHPPSLDEVPRSHARRVTGRNVLLVTHSGFAGSSAYHAYSIASELARRGWFPAVAVPASKRGARELGRPPFPVLSFRDVYHRRLRFPDGRGPDLVHAFTPREPVRRLTLELARRFGCSYVVHLEDNEIAIRRAIVTDWDSGAAHAYIDGAAGMTVLVERLLELKPEHVPGVVVWPGYDPAVESPGRSRLTIRRDIGLDDRD